MHSITENWSNEDIQGSDTYEIVKCMGCNTFSFCHVSSNSDDFEVDPETGAWFNPEQIELYPRRLKDRKQINDAYLLPSEIRNVYSETHDALCNEMSRLASIGVRLIVELVCIHLGAKGRNLEAKINNLVTLGKITKDNADVLHATRLFGNNSAHKIQHMVITRQSSIAMSIVETLLTNVFIIPVKAKELNKK